MRSSELHRIAKGKLESTQSKTPNCSSDLALMNDSDVFELVWENGQILMQNQSSRTQKPPPCSTSSSLTSKPQVKDGGDDVITKTGRFGYDDSMSSYFQSVVPPDDDLMPWLNYQLDDSLHHDYCSELFSELSATNLNLLSSQDSAVSSSRNGNLAHAARDRYMVSTDCHSNPEQGNASKVFGKSHEPDQRRISQLYSSPMDECQTSIPSFRSSVSDLYSSSNSSNKNIQQAAFLNSSQKSPLMCGSTSTTMQTQDSLPARPLPQPFSSTGVMNFSHFSRPAALVKANLQSIDTTGGLPRLDRLRSNGKESDFGSSNTLIASTSGSKFVTAFQSQFVSLPSKVDLKSPVAEEPLSSEQSQAVCLEDASRNNGSPPVQAPGQASSFAASTAMGRQDSENIIEPAVPSLSLCSGTSVGGVSNNPKHNLKRKSRDTEESGYQSDDIEEDSMGVRKTGPAQGTGSKRSRAAEVHNLSERRRRDRINEKMKELQELIPNCNKVDKASMLDEAIEYLKTLQLQVQIMSMGNGLCMPPMILPTHAEQLSRFSPVGVGMGMGMGFGMGMIDMRGGYAGCPMIQVPSMYGTQFAGQPIPGQSGLPAIARSGLQMFGLPSQGLSTSMLHAPFIPLSGGPSINPVPMVDTPGTAASVELRDSGLRDPVQNLKLPMIQKKSTDCSQNQTSPQAISEGVEQSALVETDDQNPHISGNGAVNSTCDNRIDSGKAIDD